MDLFYKFLDKILPLFYVIAGSVVTIFSPWFGEKLKKRNRKNEIRHSLIESVYRLYSLYKDHLIHVNYNTLFSCRIDHLINELGEPNLTPDVIKRKQSLLEFFTHAANKEDNKSEVTYNKLIEVEAKLLALVSEAKDHYRREVYKGLNSLINKVIDESNIQGTIFEFQKLSQQELDKRSLELPDQLTKRLIQANKDCAILIKEISDILK